MTDKEKLKEILDKGDESEEYWGTDLNIEKNEKLTRMREMCLKIAEYDNLITPKFLPFDNSDRHAGVQLLFPSLYFGADKRIAYWLSKLYAETEDVWMSAIGKDGKIALTFSVRDMWNNNGTIHDKEKTK